MTVILVIDAATEVNTMMISESKFNQVFPRAKKGIYAAIEKQIEKAGCVTKIQQAMFLAQCGHESAGFTRFSEGFNYSTEGLLANFRKYFTPAQAVKYARKPEQIANHAYANRMGNGDEASGDGWKYRGRGIIQITGKNNYAAFREWLGRDFALHELAEDLDLAVSAAVWYWQENELASLASVEKVTVRINGGTNGLADRVALYRKLMA
uniref:Chitinase A n=1 Tax=Siphoviridae sp. cts9W16 TaxID=2823603 RepID=A0A8S5L762_9CAUD|nr:MAG TPA: Chitinase A [Siphoviridae sp. cts9W16]